MEAGGGAEWKEMKRDSKSLEKKKFLSFTGLSVVFKKLNGKT